MVNVAIPGDRVQDPLERNLPGKGLGRDPCRTPMQWDGSAHAGFSAHDPWLPVSPDYATVNVKTQGEERSSLLMLYRQLLELRRSHPALAMGAYGPITATGDLLAYVRQSHDQRFLIALNFGAAHCALSFDWTAASGRVLLSTHMDRADDLYLGNISLRANEGVIVALAGNEGSSAT
jgi:alpha-glucosidase